MKIQKNDQVLVIKGKERGKIGRVLKGFPKELKVLVEGVNLKKKHQRPRREGEKGQIIEILHPLSVANVKLICPHCKKPTKIGCKIIKEKTTTKKKLKFRICKKCGKEIDLK